MTPTQDQSQVKTVERERFEAWHRTLMVPMYPHGYARSKIVPDMYEDIDLNVRWNAWQAALSQQPSESGEVPSVARLVRSFCISTYSSEGTGVGWAKIADGVSAIRFTLIQHFSGKMRELEEQLQSVLNLGNEFGFDAKENGAWNLAQVITHIRYLHEDRARQMKRALDAESSLAECNRVLAMAKDNLKDLQDQRASAIQRAEKAEKDCEVWKDSVHDFCKTINEKFDSRIINLNDVACLIGGQFGKIQNLKRLSQSQWISMRERPPTQEDAPNGEWVMYLHQGRKVWNTVHYDWKNTVRPTHWYKHAPIPPLPTREKEKVETTNCNCGMIGLPDSLRYDGPRGVHTRVKGETCVVFKTSPPTESPPPRPIRWPVSRDQVLLKPSVN